MDPEHFGLVLLALSISLIGAAVLLLTVPGLVGQRRRRRRAAVSAGASGAEG